MKRIAIVITSTHGQTAKIAESMREILETLGHAVHVYRLRNWGDVSKVSPFGYDGVIIGGSGYGSQLSRMLTEWVYSNAARLNAMPIAFFTVGLNPLDERIHARFEDVRVIEQFLRESGLATKITASLIGSLDYTKYGPFKRFVAKRLWGRLGCSTDTSVDHEMTDWEMVSNLTLEFEQEVTRRLRVR